MQKGTRQTEESRARIRDARSRQQSAIIGRYGITRESYDAALVAGLQWCRVCKQFLHPSDFGMVKVRCLSCIRVVSEQSRAKQEDAKRQKQNEYARNWRSTRTLEQRRFDLARKYNVTLEWYDETLAAQGGHCALCPSIWAHQGSEKLLFVDHCHKTGKARGMLCAKCNTHLGILEADPTWQDRALAYLAK